MKTVTLILLLWYIPSITKSQFNPRTFWHTYALPVTEYGNDTFESALMRYDKSFREDSLSLSYYHEVIGKKSRITIAQKYLTREFSLVDGLYLISHLIKMKKLDYVNPHLFAIKVEGISYGVLVAYTNTWTMKAIDIAKVPGTAKHAPAWILPSKAFIRAHTRVYTARP
jgi:hypothetical protein